MENQNHSSSGGATVCDYTKTPQQKHIIQKGVFDHMVNRAAGPGRVLTTAMIEEILSLSKTAPDLPTTCPGPECDPVTPGWAIIHRLKIIENPQERNKWIQCSKQWNEELYLRTKDATPDGEQFPRLAKDYSHFPLRLFYDIIHETYVPDHTAVERPVSFTFFISYRRPHVSDFVFSVKFPLTGMAGQFITLYYGNSYIPGETDWKNNKVLDSAVKAALQRKKGFTPPDEEECKAIAASHSISPTVFQQCLSDYWGSIPLPSPFTISWDVLSSLLDDASNYGMQVSLLWADTDNTNNMELTFSKDPYEEDIAKDAKVEAAEMVMDYETTYSFKLFHGIFLLDHTYQLRMYKGQNSDGTRTILIESIGDSGHSYYDLNGLHP